VDGQDGRTMYFVLICFSNIKDDDFPGRFNISRLRTATPMRPLEVLCVDGNEERGG